MSSFKAYIHPNDARWRGPQRHAYLLLLVISLFVTLIWIFFIADQAYSRVLDNRYEKLSNIHDADYKNGNYYPPPTYPPVRWHGPDPEGWPRFFFRAFIALVPDTIHLPIAHILLHKNKLHPVFALVCGVIFFCLWSNSIIWGSFIQNFQEYYYMDTNSHDELVNMGIALQVFTALLYAAYMGYSAKAVHEWRKAKKDRAAFREGVREGIELASASANAGKGGEERRSEGEAAPAYSAAV